MHFYLRFLPMEFTLMLESATWRWIFLVWCCSVPSFKRLLELATARFKVSVFNLWFDHNLSTNFRSTVNCTIVKSIHRVMCFRLFLALQSSLFFVNRVVRLIFGLYLCIRGIFGVYFTTTVRFWVLFISFHEYYTFLSMYSAHNSLCSLYQQYGF